MKRTFALLCAAFGLLLLTSQARAVSCNAAAGNVVTNCGFESGSFSGWTLSGNDVPAELNNLYGVEGTDPFPLPGGTNPNNGNFQAFFSDQAADPTTLSQTLATTAGDTYTISFYLAQELLGPGSVNNLALVTFGATTIESLTNVPVEGYTLFTGTGVAASSSTILSLKFGNDVGEFLLDDVVVSTPAATTTSVPEPSSWVLFFTGALMAGWFGISGRKVFAFGR
jgi:hypothetical protein